MGADRCSWRHAGREGAGSVRRGAIARPRGGILRLLLFLVVLALVLVVELLCLLRLVSTDQIQSQPARFHLRLLRTTGRPVQQRPIRHRAAFRQLSAT